MFFGLLMPIFFMDYSFLQSPDVNISVSSKDVESLKILAKSHGFDWGADEVNLKAFLHAIAKGELTLKFTKEQ